GGKGGAGQRLGIDMRHTVVIAKDCNGLCRQKGRHQRKQDRTSPSPQRTRRDRPHDSLHEEGEAQRSYDRRPRATAGSAAAHQCSARRTATENDILDQPADGVKLSADGPKCIAAKAIPSAWSSSEAYTSLHALTVNLPVSSAVGTMWKRPWI